MHCLTLRNECKWIITSELANHHVPKALFTCVAYIILIKVTYLKWYLPVGLADGLGAAGLPSKGLTP